MATLLNTTTSKGAGNYVGETRKQLRDGFGVYNYSNKFFRYEGEWSKGKKHGHGKLLMADGSFYEGQFNDGEIQGHGYRRWNSSKNEYTGQFVKGEMSGHGVMVYGDGGRYEGQWFNNRREGEGKFFGKDGSLYEGSFHNHKKHGHGKLTSSNSDLYEGDWVNDQHQGHGVMKYKDGTIYAGQWWGGEIHGEGSMIHVSGLSYEGIWVSGRPAAEAVALRILNKHQIEVTQGNPFGFEVECVSAVGERVQEDGRVLQVTGWVRVVNIKKASEQTSDQDERLPTPFGFDVEPYCLTESLGDLSSENITALTSIMSTKTAQNSSPCESTADLQVPVEVASEISEKDGSISESQQDLLNRPNATSQASTTMNTSFEKSSDELGEPALPSLPSIIRTTKGSAVFENLYLPPLPPGFKSYSSFQEGNESTRTDLHYARRASLIRWKKAGSLLNPNLICGLNTPAISEVSSGKKKKETVADVVEKVDPKGKKKDKAKEDKTDDKFCRPGDYVIAIQDVTIPRFLDSRVQPAMIHVKVVAKKREKSKMDVRRT